MRPCTLGRMDTLLTTRQVADRLGLSPGTLENWRRAGKGPPWQKLGPRMVRYPSDSVEKWVNERSKEEV